MSTTGRSCWGSHGARRDTSCGQLGVGFRPADIACLCLTMNLDPVGSVCLWLALSVLPWPGLSQCWFWPVSPAPALSWTRSGLSQPSWDQLSRFLLRVGLGQPRTRQGSVYSGLAISVPTLAYPRPNQLRAESGFVSCIRNWSLASGKPGSRTVTLTGWIPLFRPSALSGPVVGVSEPLS